MADARYPIELPVLFGRCGDREVVLGTAPARTLAEHSFADVLDEESATGYQRPFHEPHSRDFRRYIQRPGATTIPLTLNLRAEASGVQIQRLEEDRVRLVITAPGKHLAQVDCQHRLGHLTGLDVPLAFMCFIGLSAEEEREVFTTINSKAKGLNTSLIDYNSSRLTKDLCSEDPCLFISLCLADDQDSPWRGRISKGGAVSVGLRRVASLRLMKLAIRRFFRTKSELAAADPREVAETLKAFWRAASATFEDAWSAPRSHLITKGVGVYGLTALAGDLVREAKSLNREPTETYFRDVLGDFFFDFDWSSDGELEALGGTQGASRAYQLLIEHRRSRQRDPECQTRTFS